MSHHASATPMEGSEGGAHSRHHVVRTPDAELFVEEFGLSEGPAIVLLHGLSQSSVCWLKQSSAGELRRNARIVAVDLRGHGASGPGGGGYSDSRLWANDLAAVIEQLGLKEVLLCCWSYGGLVACDYLRYKGDARVMAICFVAAAVRAGTPHAGEDFGPEAVPPGFVADSAEESVAALGAFVDSCTAQPLANSERLAMVGANVGVKPSVRRGCLDRAVDNDDVLSSLKCPVLFIHGTEDRIIYLGAAERAAVLVSGSCLKRYAGVGHMPFWEAPDRFNDDLLRFFWSVEGGQASS